MKGSNEEKYYVGTIKDYLFDKYIDGIEYIEEMLYNRWDELLKKDTEKLTDKERAFIDTLSFIRTILHTIEGRLQKAKKNKIHRLEFHIIAKEIDLRDKR